MEKTEDVLTIKTVTEPPTAKKPNTENESNTGTFLRLILFCVLLTGGIAIFFCWHCSVKVNAARIVLDDVLKSSKKPKQGNSIFFHKSNPYVENEYLKFVLFSSLVQHPEVFRLQLSPHEACAIESAALHNPDQEIFVLYESPVSWVPNSKLGIIATLRNISNVNLRNLDLKRYIENSPFENLTKPLETHKSIWSKISDFLGFLSVWRYGGTYLDFDTMTLRNLGNLGTNYAIVEKNRQELATNVFSFAPSGTGYHIVRNLLFKISKILQNACEINVIPDSLDREFLTDMYQKICRTKDFKKMESRLQCFGLRVYEQDQIHKVPENLNASKQMEFKKTVLANVGKWFVTYNWDNLNDEKTSDNIVFPGPYSLLAEKNCPKIYAYVQFYENLVYGLYNKSSEAGKTEELESNNSIPKF